MSARHVMVGLGELLWDLLPTGKVLGGAPANFAYMTQVLGSEGVVVSRIGKDELGSEALKTIEDRGMQSVFVQRDSLHRTGTANVRFDAAGQPQFTIEESVAWDFLEWTPEWREISARADVICFGSLAQRSSVSAATIEQFLLNAPESTLRICDANLREPFYSPETLRKSFQCVNVVKLNDAELLRVSALLEIQGEDDEKLAAQMLQKFDLDLVCVTKGSRGSLLLSKTECIRHPGFNIEVADAIGAGDAFTACVAHYLVQGRPLKEISNAANSFAAWVASQVGATPAISRERLKAILNMEPMGGTEASA
jgi:fructokinase